MKFEEISQSILKKDREIIKKYIEENKHYNANFGQHKIESIHILYNEWHKLFPAIKQDINCSSCRNAVFKFFSKMCEEWSKQE